MKCSERSDLVKTLLGHPDIDVHIRDNVKPLIMHNFFCFLMSLVPKCTNPYVFLPFLKFSERQVGTGHRSFRHPRSAARIQ